ncbi:Phospholipase A(1) LCAT3 [Camellia lanceoleosa]|uniref:Phospholipase A(1) LCAT3 n=1 Tax=Camellia lanceoleosa TaxID=1840588 RepID=A0ACC0H3F3_9ERIC|nr:Phospholipase A(1) LCAT3 [Camellia lanceoleosa]
MLGDCCCCFPGRSSTSGDVSDRDPVLLVSGMGGCILNSKKKKKFALQTRVWVRIFLADLEFRKKAMSLYNPQTGYTESLDDGIEIMVPEDDYGLIDKAMDGLKEKLETAYKATGGRKVNIISHSMGGLLVTCFMSLHNDVFSKYVSKWICIACPFQGAPGCINDSLLTGLQFVEGFESFFFVKRWTMHQLVVECPSMYEMLPNPEFKWEKQPEIQVWRKQSEDGETCVKLESYDSTNSFILFEEALRHNELSYGGKTVALPFNFSILKWATGTRKVLNNAQLPKGVSFYNIYGTSFDTPLDVCYGSETSPVEDLPDVCHTMQPNEWELLRHRLLLRDKAVFELIQRWLGSARKVNNHSKTSKVMSVNLD